MNKNNNSDTSRSNGANATVMRRFYWLRRFRFARKKIGGAWMKTKWRGWITYQTFVYYKAYGFDPVALMSEQDGEVRWVASENGA